MVDGRVLVIGQYLVHPSDADDFRQTVVETTRAARRIDGCLHYSFAADLEVAGLFHLSELWSDQSALDRRLASEEFRETGSKVSKMNILSRSVTRYSSAVATTL